MFAKSIKNQMNQVSHNNIILVNNTGKLVRKKRITGKITNLLFIKRERSETVTRVSVTVSHLLDGRKSPTLVPLPFACLRTFLGTLISAGKMQT